MRSHSRASCTPLLIKCVISAFCIKKDHEFYWVLLEISPEYSLEGLMLRLKLQYFDHLMRRANSLEKTLMLGKIESRRRRG